ncbi:hypothetical protein P3T43_004590 [Paraburkholderia sp. GAS41]|jgi:hypothetical protein
MEKFLLSLCWSGFGEFRRYGYHQKYHREWVFAKKSERRPIGELGILQSNEFDLQPPFDLVQGLWSFARWNGHSRGLLAGKLSACSDVQAAMLVRLL